MINKKFIESLKKGYQEWNSERKQIIGRANIVLHDSKRVIFSLHRGESKLAGEKLNEIDGVLKELDKKFGFSRLNEEGSYRAAIEEYVEAKLFFSMMEGKKLDKIGGVKLSTESYLGGICDLTGELVRVAVNQAAAGKTDEVARLKKVISDIMAELVQFDMTGYLRTKYDQAKGNLRKIEQINYEINIRR